MNGDHDVMVPTINSYKLKEEIPNSILHIYPDAGHMSFFQYSQDFSERIDKFLNK
ncbi:hypothetical protein GCM10022297_04580 [Lactobacillus hamsteri]|uniref:Peptidase S33 tripeptidyl aminopeptidase-like C-terminal domain-containing protein n=1 Tax=Lactobacillus hamsteri DSM 5661 = JCM 6256 TaxID=1423754 RepID=A0A0R1YMJ1_9LACO|nr:alpha/beta hydrolase [Lactobacillus hamsteri]KRM40451.1 hypothetical protein FC39_GL000593 [Lactobacillus hamsteri DSM 5661 = JCM 6256]